MAQAELLQPLAIPRTRWSRGLFAAAAMLLAVAAGLSVGGQIGRVAVNGLLYAPVILLAGLLQLRSYKTARVLSWIWFWTLVLGAAVVALSIVFVNIAPLGLQSPARVTAAEMQQVLQQLVAPVVATLGILLVGIILAATPAWAALGRVLGVRHLDQAHPAHAQGTVGLLVGSALAIAPLALLGGRAPLIDMLNKVDMSSIGMAEQVIDQVSSVAWTIVLVLWASAWPTRLSLSAACTRLGLRRLNLRAAVPLVAITVMLVGLGMALDFVNHAVLGWLGWPMTDASVITRLMSVATTPLGAVIIALCAGVSEELLFRGLLQPRFGWLLSNVGFAALHGFQYGVDGLVVVFVIGGVLAYVRQRWSTSASIGVHAGYDLILLLLAQLGF